MTLFTHILDIHGKTGREGDYAGATKVKAFGLQHIGGKFDLDRAAKLADTYAPGTLVMPNLWEEDQHEHIPEMAALCRMLRSKNLGVMPYDAVRGRGTRSVRNWQYDNDVRNFGNDGIGLSTYATHVAACLYYSSAKEPTQTAIERFCGVLGESFRIAGPTRTVVAIVSPTAHNGDYISDGQQHAALTLAKQCGVDAVMVWADRIGAKVDAAVRMAGNFVK